MNILLGLSGKPRSGKDSVAKYIVDNYGFKQYAIADRIKWIAGEYFGFTHEELWENKTKESRRFLQQLGKFVEDFVSPTFFIDEVIESIKKDIAESFLNETPCRIVVSDVRRFEEVSIFDRSSTAFLIPGEKKKKKISLTNAFDKILVAKIQRSDENILKEEPGLEENMKHSVEQLPNTYTDWDYFIQNNSTKEDLHRAIDTMMFELLGEAYHDSNKRKSL